MCLDIIVNPGSQQKNNHAMILEALCSANLSCEGRNSGRTPGGKQLQM